MVLRKRNSCISIIMLTMFDTTYTVLSAFSVTPPMLLEHDITFARRSCMLAVFRSRIEGAASLQSFRTKTEGSWGKAISFNNKWSRTASSFGCSTRNKRFRRETPRVILSRTEVVFYSQLKVWFARVTPSSSSSSSSLLLLLGATKKWPIIWVTSISVDDVTRECRRCNSH